MTPSDIRDDNQANRVKLSYKEIVNLIHTEAWNQEIYDNIENCFAEEAIIHLGTSIADVSTPLLKQIVARWKSSFPDLYFDIISIIQEENMVAVNCLLKGTHQGEFRGMEGTGKTISVPHAFFFRFETHKIVEIWEINDFSKVEDYLRED